MRFEEKNMSKKLKRSILVLLMPAMLLALAGCSGISVPSEENEQPGDTVSETDNTAVTEEKKTDSPEVDPIDAYTPLLTHFFRLVSDPYGEDDDSDGSLGVQENARIMEDSALDGIGYIIEDLSGDGIPELAVGTLPEYGGQINALYTLVDGEPRFVFEGWYRSRYMYLGEGRFFYYGSNGAAETGKGIVTLTGDGTTLRRDGEGFYFTQLCDGEIRVYYNETGIWDLAQSEESDMSLDDFWAWEPAQENLPMVSFSSYAAANGYEFPQHDDGLAVHAEWADGALTETSEYEIFIADDGEYSTDVLFITVRPLTDFKLMSLSVREVYDDGSVSYVSEPLYSMENLIPDRPLVARMVFPGDTPAYGISYVDDYGDGKTHFLTVEISGEDGSLILRET